MNGLFFDLNGHLRWVYERNVVFKYADKPQF